MSQIEINTRREKLKRGQLPPAVANGLKCKYIVDGKNWIAIPSETSFQQAMELYEQLVEDAKINLNLEPVRNIVERQWEVKSTKNPETIYIVRLWSQMGWTCECLGFQFRKNCKHIEKCTELINKE
jgi:hypothetical protein